MLREHEVKINACLDAAIDRINQGWTRKAFARDERGYSINCLSPHATCWCMLGAIYRGAADVLNDDTYHIDEFSYASEAVKYNSPYQNLYVGVVSQIEENMPDDITGLITLNDNHGITKNDILDILEKAKIVA